MAPSSTYEAILPKSSREENEKASKNDKEQQSKTLELASPCTPSCSSFDDPETTYKEEYKCEIADNQLYYGNKDVSQEDIYFSNATLSPTRPKFVLPSFRTLGSLNSPQPPGAHFSASFGGMEGPQQTASAEPSSALLSSGNGSGELNSNVVLAENQEWQI